MIIVVSAPAVRAQRPLDTLSNTLHESCLLGIIGSA